MKIGIAVLARTSASVPPEVPLEASLRSLDDLDLTLPPLEVSATPPAATPPLPWDEDAPFTQRRRLP